MVTVGLCIVMIVVDGINGVGGNIGLLVVIIGVIVVGGYGDDGIVGHCLG